MQNIESDGLAEFVISPLILQSIKSVIASHGFGGFWFQGIPNRAYQDYLLNSKKSILTRRMLYSSGGVFSSSHTAQKIQRHYIDQVAPRDINFGLALKLEQPYYYQLSERGQVNKANKLFSSYGIKTVLSYPVRHYASEAWCGRFTLLSKERELNFDLVDLDTSLKQLQTVLFEHYHQELNPYRQVSLFNQTAIKALKMVAKGLQNSEISEELHITIRGVEYHLESMRNKLSASNRANLVHIAHQLEII
ncbi:helix-turn-helix transcriptional regulator [Shewanella eurypsychrophilus]|uniref:Helix-turn-helix transcriptional regulator n=1 Tax=Shewanella eurypsychrophilus TaxID=2593656 RepID=A0ABX6VCY0_9GAMM|nr:MULTISPECIES: helix-turn-helix transcriptional regulator [Shewanella]QFU24539.1 LuxR family transcriptional regulator [Shewanella sp. YLB-09]QPG59736.1 helix-turn-helix transcriptional regulator [Shewanella eurypsychrophilus]